MAELLANQRGPQAFTKQITFVPRLVQRLVERIIYFCFMDDGCALRRVGGVAGLGKGWAAMVTLASTRNERLLAPAARAGCSCLFLGLESFSPESLRLANKAFNVVIERCLHDIIRAKHIVRDGFDNIRFHERDMLMRGGMEDDLRSIFAEDSL